METKSKFDGLVVKYNNSSLSGQSDCSLCCLNCKDCECCPLLSNYYFENSSEIKLRDFTGFNMLDLKDAIKWHSARLKYWNDSLGSAIYLGLDYSDSLERVSYHSACISKAEYCIKTLKLCGLTRVK